MCNATLAMDRIQAAKKVVFAIVAFSVCLGQEECTAQNEQERCTASLRELGLNWHGKKAVFESKLIDTERVPLKITLSISPDGKIARRNVWMKHVIKTGDTRIQNSWTYRTPDILFSWSVSWLNDKQHTRTTCSAKIPGKTPIPLMAAVFTPVQHFLAIDLLSETHWYEIVADKTSLVDVEVDNGEITLEVKNPKYGEYTFVFVDVSVPRLIEVTCTKNKTSTDFGEFPYESYAFELDGIKTREIDGKLYISAIDRIQESNTRIGETVIKRFGAKSQYLRDVSNLNERLNSRITLPNIEY